MTKPYDKWQETTLRKGTKTPKICKDMFITDSNGKFTFCEVKNGVLLNKIDINKNNALEYISIEKLVAVPHLAFSNCKTYRTEASNKLIEIILDSIENAE